MNAGKLMVAATLFAATGLVLAQSAEYVAPDANFVSSKTRAEVRAELKQAKADGILSFREDTYPVIAAGDRSQQHAGTQGDTIQSARSGHLDRSIYFGS